MSSSPTPPAVTNPNTVAANQQTLNTQSGQQSQEGSMVNQANPYGNLTYSQTGTASDGTPLYTASTTFSPQQQQLLNTLTGTQQQAGNDASTLLATGNYGSGVSPGTTIGNSTSGETQALLNQETSYLNPQFTQQTTQLDTQLKNQGFDPSSPAYQQAMNNLYQSQQQTVTGFLAQAEPAAYQQATASYELPEQMATALAGFGSPTSPTGSFTSTPSLTIQPANLVGATANAQTAEQQTYQDQLNQQNAMLSGLFGTGSALLGGWAKSGGASSLLGAVGL